MILALALSTGVVALSAHGASAGSEASRTIRLISTTTQVNVLVDRAPKRVANAGDVFLARSMLRNGIAQFGKPTGAVVGGDVATVSLVSANRSDVKMTVKLPGGTLRVAGRVEDQRVQTIPVVGGTGAFAGARGTCAITGLDASGNRARNVYRLSLP